MSKMNILVYLNAYRDSNPSNNPSLSNFKWSREFQGLSAEKPQSIEFCLAPGESRTLFNGQRSLSSDNTTTYDIALKSGSTYRLTHVSGAAPAFRTLRAISSDATTEVQVSVAGTIVTFTSIAGTAFNFGTTQVGDEALIGPAFNAANQGKFKIIGKTANSISVENSSGVAEASIILGAGFEDEVRVYSAAGVQKGDKIILGAGFSAITQATYEITGVQDNQVEFFASAVLPQETALLNPSVTIYSAAKKFVYMETDKKTGITVNGVAESSLEPFVESSGSFPGLYMKKSVMWSMVVTNNSTDMATYYFAGIE